MESLETLISTAQSQESTRPLLEIGVCLMGVWPLRCIYLHFPLSSPLEDDDASFLKHDRWSNVCDQGIRIPCLLRLQ